MLINAESKKLDKLVLKFLGVDFWSRPVYKDQNGILLKDINCDDEPISLCTVCGDFEGEPCTPIEYIKRYQGLEIEIIGREEEPTKEEKFKYQMLDRLRMDCEYYLGFGNKSTSRLYYKDEQEHISKMKELYNSFPDNKKPERLTFEQILNYEKIMINK